MSVAGPSDGHNRYPVDPGAFTIDELSAVAREQYAADLRSVDDLMLANIHHFTGTYNEQGSLWTNVAAGYVYVGTLREQLRRHPTIDLGSGNGMPGELRARLGIDDYTAVDIDRYNMPEPEAGQTRMVQDEALHFLSQQSDGSANVISSAFLGSSLFGSAWLDPGKLEQLQRTHSPEYASAISRLGAFVQRVLTEVRRVIPDDGRLVVAYSDYPDELFAGAGFAPDEDLTVYATLNKLSFGDLIFDDLTRQLIRPGVREVFTEEIPVIRVFKKTLTS